MIFEHSSKFSPDNLAVLQLLSEGEIEIMKSEAYKADPVDESKFFGHHKLSIGKPADAAQSLEDLMQVQAVRSEYYNRISREEKGIQEEVDRFASDSTDPAVQQAVEDAKDLLDYICSKKREPRKKDYPNGTVDGGTLKSLQDFQTTPQAVRAKLSVAELVALRFYTTTAYQFMNNPLRDGTPCLLPVTTYFAYNGIKKLRRMHVGTDGTSLGKAELWRGLRNRELSDGFTQRGGTELAFMSTTRDLRVAVHYCLIKEHAPRSLVFKVVAPDFMSMGADVQWLSTFPGEAEIVYPPLTYLKPTGREQVPAGWM